MFLYLVLICASVQNTTDGDAHHNKCTYQCTKQIIGPRTKQMTDTACHGGNLMLVESIKRLSDMLTWKSERFAFLLMVCSRFKVGFLQMMLPDGDADTKGTSRCWKSDWLHSLLVGKSVNLQRRTELSAYYKFWCNWRFKSYFYRVSIFIWTNANEDTVKYFNLSSTKQSTYHFICPSVLTV